MASLLAASPRITCLVAVLLGGCKSVAPVAPPAPPVAAVPVPAAVTPLERLDVLVPSNTRNWHPDLAVLAHADVQGDRVTIHNIRDFLYQSDDDYVMRYYDKTFDLRDIESVDFIVVPFKDAPRLAHTMLSFGFRGGDYVAASVEARLQEGEEYSPLAGAMRQYELIYVIADERDLIARRTRHRNVDVYLYRTRATPEQARALFVDVLQRTNKLAEQPEFYDTLTNNCTTNIVRHVNQLDPGRVPFEWRLLLPGYSDRLAYDLGLLATEGSFEATREKAKINALANRVLDAPDFSLRIRR